MNITKFALDNTRIVILTTLIIIFGGVYLFGGFPKLEDPSITIREALVVAKYPGMPVEQVERLITRPIEEQLRSMGEVDNIRDSTSKLGESLIHVTIKDEVPSDDLTMVWKLLRNKMSDVAPLLPEGTIGPIVNDSFGDTSVATIAVWSDGFSMAEMYETSRRIRERLNQMEGVQKIEMTGVQEERIFIEVSNAKLAQFGVDIESISRSLQQQNILLPAGRVNIHGVEMALETMGRFKSTEEIEQVLIQIPGSEGTIHLRDIASIRKGYVEPLQTPAYYNGHQAIVLSVYLLSGVDAVGFGEKLTNKVHNIEQALPIGYKLEFATYQPTLIDKSVNSMVINVVESVAIVLTVVMLLLGLRTGLIVGTFIPLVMLYGVVMMSILGIEMQRMSLATMIIALGMFVDNAIVVSDDIKVNLDKGMGRREAALKSGNSLAVPLLTSTLTTVFAFGPILLQIGSVGDYTSSLGSVMVLLLLGSWFFSLFSTPCICAWFMKAKKPVEEGEQPIDPYQGKFYSIYRSILRLGLQQKGVVIAIAGVLFAFAIYGLTVIPQSFFPTGDRNQFLIYLDHPAGTRIEETDQTVRELSAWLQDKNENPEITGTVAYVANGGPRFFLSLSPPDPDPFNGFLIVNTESGAQVPEVLERTRLHILNNFPDIRGRCKQMFLGPSEPGLLKIRLSGPDMNALRNQSEQVMTALRGIPNTLDIMQDWNNLVLVGMIEVDQARARRAGVTSQEVAESLKGFIDGTMTTTFTQGNVEIPIIGRGVKNERESLDNIATISIYSHANQNQVPLTQVADLSVRGEPNRIVRYNQERTITVSAVNLDLTASELLGLIKPTLDGLEYPDNHYWEVGGELEDSAIAQKNLAKWVPLCLGAMMLLLVWQFNSFRRASIIMLTIPLVIVGTVVGLLVMRADFGFMVILGILALTGSIVNNGIVMIDKIEENRRNGQTDYDAIINSAISRFRPILLSVATTMLGFLPLIINRDPLFYGMACVMFFGLGIGSLFTLNYVPALYALFFKVQVPTEEQT